MWQTVMVKKYKLQSRCFFVHFCVKWARIWEWAYNNIDILYCFHNIRMIIHWLYDDIRLTLILIFSAAAAAALTTAKHWMCTLTLYEITYKWEPNRSCLFSSLKLQHTQTHFSQFLTRLVSILQNVESDKRPDRQRRTKQKT